MLYASCGWCLKGEVSEVGHDDGLRVTAWRDWLEAVVEISGDVGLGRELVANIDHRRDGHQVLSRRGVGQSVCHMILIIANGQ